MNEAYILYYLAIKI